MPRIQPASRWTVFDPLTNAQNILVNILPLDEQVEMGDICNFSVGKGYIYIYIYKDKQGPVIFCRYIVPQKNPIFDSLIFRAALGSRVNFLLCRKPGHLGARRTTVLADACA